MDVELLSLDVEPKESKKKMFFLNKTFSFLTFLRKLAISIGRA